MKKLKLGIIGFGKSTSRYHLPYLNIRDHIQVVAIAGRSESAEKAAYCEAHGIKWTTNVDDLLNDETIEAVVIITPAESHFDMTKQALLAGKHVICEKPFVESLEQAQQLVELAKSQGLVLMPFQNRRFDGDYLATKKVIERGILGRLVEVETHFDYYRGSDAVNRGAKINGFAYGHAVHLIDRMVALFGRPKRVFADVKNVRAGSGLDDYHDIHLFYENGFKVICKSSHLVALPYPQFTVHGTRGSFVKYGIDQQETDIKAGMLPGDDGFGVDNTFAYGKAKYLNQNEEWIEREIPTPLGDNGAFYDALYATIVEGAPKLISDEQILMVIEILDRATAASGPHVFDM